MIKETLWPVGLRVELGSDAAQTTERLVAARLAGFDGVELCAPEGRLTEDAISSAIEALARVPIIGLDGGDDTLPAENQSPVRADAAGERDRDPGRPGSPLDEFTSPDGGKTADCTVSWLGIRAEAAQ
ncbi:MAG: hypothetical protein IID36_07615 [Planctomycetes bacterium]|nr:hypothetical protein [Planctomycetota bacterium]